MSLARITIEVAPRTKKNSSTVIYLRKPTRSIPSGWCGACRRGALPRVMPSDAYEDMEARVLAPLRRAWRGREAIAYPVLVEAVFFRDALRGDLLGYQQALADVLQAAQVVVNDKWIVGWPMPADGGLPLRKDAARPRVEVVIREVPLPLFGYREDTVPEVGI